MLWVTELMHSSMLQGTLPPGAAGLTKTVDFAEIPADAAKPPGAAKLLTYMVSEILADLVMPSNAAAHINNSSRNLDISWDARSVHGAHETA